MITPQTSDRLECEFLRAVYELADGTAKRHIPYVDVCHSLDHSESEADEACTFWTDRGTLEWTLAGHIALTYVGLRRAARLAERGWGPSVPF